VEGLTDQTERTETGRGTLREGGGDRDNEHRVKIERLRPGETRRRTTRGKESPIKGIEESIFDRGLNELNFENKRDGSALNQISRPSIFSQRQSECTEGFGVFSRSNG
jgi:hypothetical protein